MDIKESEMEDLIESHPEDFFPRRVWALKGRQGVFHGIGRYDLLFEDQFKSNILMELKAVPAKLDVAEQLVRYQQALEGKGEKNIIMWLVAPLIPKQVADFLDRFGVEHTEIHAAEFRQVASRYGYSFASESVQTKPTATQTGQNNIRPAQLADGRATGWSIASGSKQGGSAEEFLGRCDNTGKTFFSTVFERQKSHSNKAKITWNHESGFSMQFYFRRLGFVEMVWGFPAVSRDGKPRGQKLAFPFDFALKRGVEEKFINDFGSAVSARVPFSGGNKRPNIAVRNFSQNDVSGAVEAIFEFAERASFN
jgi:hypothetical protein